jgi:glycosyltransferase involved in cell wall biosynthesis
MRVVFVLPFVDMASPRPLETLKRYPITRELPLALARRGHQVEVLVHSPVERRARFRGVEWRFLRAGPVVEALGECANRWRPNYGPAWYQPNRRIASRIREIHPDIVHFFGLTMDLQLAVAAQAARSVGARLVVHYHGGGPAASVRRWLQRHNLADAHRVLFTSLDQATPWLEAEILRQEQVGQLIETSSPFRGMDRLGARALTGMVGDPVYLSAGRLHPIKDPLTMLAGFARIVQERPTARLYLYYLTNELLPELREMVAQDPRLRETVVFRGRAPLGQMEAVYSSADFLLQASTREWSGLAVLEAMSCGCIPVVTNIPSFVTITDGGRAGLLFEPADPGGLAEAVLRLTPVQQADLAAAARDFVDRNLSFEAMAESLERVYLER